jgi:hypothetical protein
MPYVNGLPSKQLELARELVPGATRIGLIDDIIDPKAHPQRQEIEATGRTLEEMSVHDPKRTSRQKFAVMHNPTFGSLWSSV